MTEWSRLLKNYSFLRRYIAGNKDLTLAKFEKTLSGFKTMIETVQESETDDDQLVYNEFFKLFVTINDIDLLNYIYDGDISKAVESFQEHRKNHNQENETKINIPKAMGMTIKCPIAYCQCTVNTVELLAHIMDMQCQNPLMPKIRNINIGKRSLFMFSPEILIPHKNTLLGILACKPDLCDWLPMPKYENPSNLSLTEKYKEYENHTIILVLACFTNWNAFRLKKTKAGKKKPNLLIIWLTNIETSKPLHGQLTVFDKERLTSRNKTLKVRRLDEAHNICDCFDENLIKFTTDDIKLLTRNGKEPIAMEVMIN